MAWAVPATAVAGQALTAAMWNSSIRDNLLASEAAQVTQAGQTISGTGLNSVVARGPQSASVTTSQTTASGTYGDLATAGPSVTLDTGPQALIILSATMAQSTANGYANATYTVSGASAFTSGWAILNFRAAAANDQIRMTGLDYPVAAITAGTNTFKMIYATSGTGTATFVYRNIIVWPI